MSSTALFTGEAILREAQEKSAQKLCWVFAIFLI
jgi:hypothetical protein